jgi:hypothetical protein
MSASVQEQLRQAYQLIRSGQKAAALQILAPLQGQDPENENVWWLTANALDDPAKQKIALQNVLFINPSHEQAQQMLAFLSPNTPSRQTQTAPVAKTSTQTMAPATKRGTQTMAKPAPKKTNGALVIGAILVLVLGLGGLIGALLLTQPDPAEQAAAEATIIVPTSIADLFTDTPTFTPSPTATATATRTPLPPTWTPIPSNTPLFIPTWTPYWEGTPLSTADPRQFGDHYFEGVGDGFTLDKFTRSGGRYLRFYEFPIKVWFGPYGGGLLNEPVWEAAVRNAVNEISQVVPMELVANEPEATLVVYLVDPESYELYSKCSAVETLGCAVILDLGDFGGGDVYHRIYGEAWLNIYEITNPYSVILHEMLHAVGLMVHSPNENDVMYPFENGVSRLTRRDLNTLRLLYANPSYAD